MRAYSASISGPSASVSNSRTMPIAHPAEVVRAARRPSIRRPGRSRSHPSDRARHRVVGERRVFDRARERPDLIEARSKRDQPVARHAAVRRLEPDDVAERARFANRAAGVAPEPDRGFERRDRGRRCRPSNRPARASRSYGLRVTPSAEFSHELPIANSSMFALPIGTAPASSSRATAVAVYGAVQCSEILLPHVVRVPRQAHVVLDRERHAGQRQALAGRDALVDARARARAPGRRSASGTRRRPGRRFGMREHGFGHFPRRAAARNVPRRRCGRGAAVRPSLPCLFRDDARHAEEPALALRRLGQHDVARQARPDPVRRGSRCAAERLERSPRRRRSAAPVRTHRRDREWHRAAHRRSPPPTLRSRARRASRATCRTSILSEAMDRPSSSRKHPRPRPAEHAKPIVPMRADRSARGARARRVPA